MLSFVKSITLKGDLGSPNLDVLIEPTGSVIVTAALVASDYSESELVLSLPIELNSSLISLRALRSKDLPPVMGLVGAVCAVTLP